MENSYPVYRQYGKYSVNFTELSEKDLEQLREATKGLGVDLVYNGVNF